MGRYIHARACKSDKDRETQIYTHHQQSDDSAEGGSGEHVAPVVLVVGDACHRGEPGHEQAYKLQYVSE